MATFLEQLNQFIDSAQPICIITGETNLRTTLLKEWMDSQDNTLRYLYFIASNQQSTEKFAEDITKKTQLELPDFSSAEQLNNCIKKLEALTKPVIILIENADELPTLSLAALYQLACYQTNNEKKFHLVLAGRDTLVEKIEQLADGYFDSEIFQINLDHQMENATQTETPDELESDTDDEAESEPAVETVAAEEPATEEPSAVIEIEQNEITIEMDASDDTKPPKAEEEPLPTASSMAPEENYSNEELTFWQKHKVKIISVVILAFLFIFLWKYEHKMNETSNQIIQTPIKPPQPLTTPTRLPTKLNQDDVTKVPMQKPKATPSIKTSAKQGKEPVKPAATMKVTPKKSAGQLAHPAKIAPQNLTKATVRTHHAKQLHKAKTAPAPAHKVAAQAHYTIQLMASPNQAGLEKAAKRYQLGPQAMIKSKQIEGQTWYELRYGQYQTKADAQAGLKKLPPALLNRVHPWVKQTKDQPRSQ